ncbi:MAG: hypothetical protein HY907_16705 [Deltaproteobacteria bacterium]|nr:hypothetical protein [Deltaproteobacteria bacterium]
MYRGDLRAVESRYRRKPDALARIAARSGIGRLRLSAWIRAYIARKYLGAAGLDVDLPMSDFEALRPLALHPDAAREVLALRARHHLSTKRLDALAVEWRRRLDEGGRLEDLVAAVRPVAASPRPGKPRPHHPLAGADLVPLRLALVVSRWLHAATLAPRLRAGLSEEIRRLRTAVASGIAPPPSLLAAPESPASDLAAPGASGPEPTEEPGASDEVVDAAVRFIAQCVRRHGLRFALEVGEYLFREVYRGNRASFRNGGLQWQRDTIQTIARDPRVGLESSFLYKSIHAYLLVGLAAQNVPADALPELSLNKWEALWPLEENPAALAQVGTWAAAERVPAATVAEIAALVAPYVARGGSLDDLLAGSARRPPDTPYRRIRRLLGVIRSLLAERPVSPAARPRLLSALDACRTGPERPPADRGGESGKSGKRTGPA